MGTQRTRVVFVAAAIALGVGLAGCGSGSGTGASTSEQTAASSSPSTSSAVPSTTAPPAGRAGTVGDYLRENGITQAMVKRGDPTAPRLNLPMPAGWRDVGADTPEDAYGAIVFEGATGAPSPPAIIARMARLSGGDVDQAKILELAPNAVTNQPGYQGPETGQPSSLSGFSATEIAGTVVQEGQPVFVARKTLVIPGTDGVYLLALDAQSAPDQQAALLDAMSVIDAETTIEP